MFTINLTVEQLQSNYQQLFDYINNVITGERRDKLLKLFEDYSEKIMLAPASSMLHFYSAYPGGFCIHTILTLDFAEKIYNMWKSCGADMSGYEFEELIFSALTHDLGKLGTLEHDFYIPNDSDWHIKNRGELYKINPELGFMRPTERTIYLLNKYGITLTENEYIAIIAHDGAFSDNSKEYFTQFMDERKLRTNLPIILHYADYMAHRIEYERERKIRIKHAPNQEKSRKKSRKELNDESRKKIIDGLDNLFKD